MNSDDFNKADSSAFSEDSLTVRIQKEARMLYQNYEQEGLSVFMPLIKDITNAILPYTTSGNSDVQTILQNLQKGVEAYKHTDMIGMADCLILIGGLINE